MGICEVLIPLTNSPSVEVQGNSAAAIGNLSSKGALAIYMRALTTADRAAAEDYAPFNAVWNKPDGGLHAYLVRFLSSADITFQHIAVWVGPNPLLIPDFAEQQTIVQLLESEDEQLTNNIRSSPILISSIRQLAESPPASRQGRRSDGHDGDEDYDDEGMDADGEGEIVNLARRILDLTEDGRGDGEGSHFQPVPGGQTAQTQGGQQHAPGQAQGQGQGQGQGDDHAALRASVHQALKGGR